MGSSSWEKNERRITDRSPNANLYVSEKTPQNGQDDLLGQPPSEQTLDVCENTRKEDSSKVSPSPTFNENLTQCRKVEPPYFSLSNKTSDSLLLSLQAIKRRRMEAKK